METIIKDEDVQRCMENYTHKDLAERLYHAITDSGYELEEIDQSDFDNILDHFIKKEFKITPSMISLLELKQ